MNILILNWRDPKNPKSGGAEKLNMQILRPFLDRGDSVTWYAMRGEDMLSEEKYKGIHIVRFGNSLTHFLYWPYLYFTKRFGKIDLIIDSIHGTGYLSPIIAPRVRKIILICEVAQNIWDEMYPFPINQLGKIWEKLMFQFYRNNNFWTISNSSKNDLIHFGIKPKNVEILPMGFDSVKISKNISKFKEPTALFVGRLNEMKGVKDVILAIANVNSDLEKKWYLNIVGRGELSYEKELKEMVSNLEMNKYIRFLGFISEVEKFEEMAKSWVLMVPSSREGWGMIVPEANSVGTIAVGYSVPGLKDVLKAYSDKNVLIPPSVKNLRAEVTKIKKPVIVTKPISHHH